jgi:hypothetical protein
MRGGAQRETCWVVCCCERATQIALVAASCALGVGAAGLVPASRASSVRFRGLVLVERFGSVVAGPACRRVT